VWRDIAGKEIRANVVNGRSAAVLVVAAGLFVTLGVLGARNYNHQRSDYDARVSGHREELSTYKSLNYIDSGGLYVDRRPAPLSSIVRGVEGSFGNILRVQRLVYPQYSGGPSDSPLVTAFEPVDFLFVMKIVLSLCALLLTFDAVSGERENGTLPLLLSASASRLDVLTGKLVGALVTLLLPCSIGFAAGVATVAMQLHDPLSPLAWLRILAIWGVTALYLALFLCLGLLASSMARTSIVSLTIALLAWLTIVVVTPRVLVAAAGRAVPAPDMGRVEAEVEMVRQTARRNAIRKLHYIVESTGQQLSVETVFVVNRGEAEAGAVRVRALREAYERQRGAHDRMARAVTTLVPAGALSGAVMTLAGTDLRDYDRYLDEFKQYRDGILRYYAQFTNRSTPFDPASVQRFEPRLVSLGEAFATASRQVTALVTWLVVMLGASAVAFHGYDPR
jgi:ABC-type transport system involved in multi-copper enzyme maturation permease subunit